MAFLIIVFVIIGILVIKNSLLQISKSINISEKILNIYLNSNK